MFWQHAEHQFRLVRCVPSLAGLVIEFLPAFTTECCREEGSRGHSLETGTPGLGSFSFPLVCSGDLTCISKEAGRGRGERTG